ncbi:MAG: superinfection immunity protein [SAR324 cluster bacterium]|nr:superinfection immunity protein [SAR324 cluster bacterium]
MEGLGGVFLGIIFLVGAALIYFVPAMIAWFRQHQSFAAVLMLNALLGWTVVGWIAILLWALSGPGAAESPSEKTFKSNWPQS